MLLSPTALANDCVILPHGLARVSNSMSELERKLGQSGYDVVNINYPSIRYEIDVLAADAVGRGISRCLTQSPERIHFVTHSLGGILVRYYLQKNELELLGRVVMLGPPNKGSEMVDGLSPLPGFGLLGPTSRVLGTEEESVINELGPVEFELGVIAGSTSIGDYVTIAGQVGIIGHLNIGNHCTIASKSQVTKSLKDNSFVSGIPSRDHKKNLKLNALFGKLDLLYRDFKNKDNK